MNTVKPGPEAQDLAKLRWALEDANVPTLLPVLFQLTGERRWLEPPNRPERSRGMDDNQTGGLPDGVQAEIRDQCAAAVHEWALGKPAMRPTPRGRELQELMAVTAGETIPPEYVSMVEEQMGFVEPERHPTVNGKKLNFKVAIVGAGVSGLTAALRLREAGIPYVILEKNQQVGGTWFENGYPGCGVDTPSYLYSFTYFRRKWTQHFAKRAEVERYLHDLASELDLMRDIRFGVEVLKAEWDDVDRLWVLTMDTPDGPEQLVVNAVITAVGQLNRPKVPDVAGLDTFHGASFHSARWPKDLDITGKRVAIVGSGASAMQIVPAIVDQVKHVSIFQRSPQWITPNEKYFEPIGDRVHWLMENVPFYFDWYRFKLGWIFNDKVHPSLQREPSWPHPDRSVNQINEGHRRFFARYIERELEGRPDLVVKAMPDYPPFGKRMLLDNGWYRALRMPHVELITESVSALDSDGVVSQEGTHREVDVVVFATGFEAQRPTYPMDIRGLGGRTLREVWHDDDARAYLGVSSPGFPNLFFMYGPNTNLGHGGSFTFLAESQARYIADLLCGALGGGWTVMDCKADVHDRYNEELDAAHERMIWTHPGITTWYRNRRGRVVTNMPWRVVEYWAMTRHARLDDYNLTPDGAEGDRSATTAQTPDLGGQVR